MIARKILEEKRNEILCIVSRHGVKAISVFGSCARGDARADSDVDFLIEVGGPTTPWFPGGLVSELEELLGCRVDVVEPDALRMPVRKEVLGEAVPL